MILRVSVEVTAPDAIVIRPVGDIDYSSLDPLRQALMDARMAGVREIVLDLADVDFLDSQGLAVILYAHRRQRTTGGGRLVLRNLNDLARRLVHVTNLTAVLEVEGGLGEPPTPAATGPRSVAASRPAC